MLIRGNLRKKRITGKKERGGGRGKKNEGDYYKPGRGRGGILACYTGRLLQQLQGVERHLTQD